MSSCARRQLRIEAGTKREDERKRGSKRDVSVRVWRGKKGEEEKGSGVGACMVGHAGGGGLACVCVAIRELVKYIIPLDVSERWTARSRLYSISRVPSA